MKKYKCASCFKIQKRKPKRLLGLYTAAALVRFPQIRLNTPNPDYYILPICRKCALKRLQPIRVRNGVRVIIPLDEYLRINDEIDDAIGRAFPSYTASEDAGHITTEVLFSYNIRYWGDLDRNCHSPILFNIRPSS